MASKNLIHIGALTLFFNAFAPGTPSTESRELAPSSIRSEFSGLVETDRPKTDTLGTSVVTPLIDNDTLPRGKNYACVIMNYNTGEVLYGVDADEHRKPASTVKVMTAYLLFEALKDGRLTMDQKIPVSAHAAAVGREPGVMDMGLSYKGKQVIKSMTVKDALLGTVIQSGCDAAIVVAEAVAGSEKAFVAKMNETAKKLGMTNTHFANPEGLTDPNMHTTVGDMAKLCAAMIRDFPEYYPLFDTEKFTFNGHTFKNHNDLLQTFPGADGIKTGYTDASGWNLTASAERNGQRVIVVVFGASTKVQRQTDVSCYLEYAFQKIDDPTLAFNADTTLQQIERKDFYIPCGDTTATAALPKISDDTSGIARFITPLWSSDVLKPQLNPSLSKIPVPADTTTAPVTTARLSPK